MCLVFNNRLKTPFLTLIKSSLHYYDGYISMSIIIEQYNKTAAAAAAAATTTTTKKQWGWPVIYFILSPHMPDWFKTSSWFKTSLTQTACWLQNGCTHGRVLGDFRTLNFDKKDQKSSGKRPRVRLWLFSLNLSNSISIDRACALSSIRFTFWDVETTSDGLPSEQPCLVCKCGRDEKKRDRQKKEEK